MLPFPTSDLQNRERKFYVVLNHSLWALGNEFTLTYEVIQHRFIGTSYVSEEVSKNSEKGDIKTGERDLSWDTMKPEDCPSHQPHHMGPWEVLEKW